MQPRGQQRRAIPGTVPLRSTAACAGATELRFPRKLTSLLSRCCSALTTKVCSCCDAITSRVPPTLQFILPMLLYSLCPRRRHEAPRRPCPWRYGVAKGWSPSGGLVSGPLAASASLCSVLSLASSLSCIPSSLFSSPCCSFYSSHFAPVSSTCASGHRLRPQVLRPFAAPSLAQRNARSDEIIILYYIIIPIIIIIITITIITRPDRPPTDQRQGRSKTMALYIARAKGS